jgi:putative tryptophan/tyrosine transport system ATP-binding protein
MMMMIEDIGITFNAHTPDENCALRHVNLEISKGDFITVIGSNGAGKSTLYNVIAGTLIPTAGKIFLNTASSTAGDKHSSADTKLMFRDITRDAEYKRARYIGRIFQNPLLGTAGKMSLEDNMMICYKKGFKGLGISLTNKMRSYFRDQLRVLNMGLEDRLRDNVEQFSGGQRQALTLLMAVMSHPDLLLLDEHTAALDPANAEVVMNLTRTFAKDYGLTVMMVTHNMQQALDFGSRLLMMDSGEIILDINKKEKEKLTMSGIVEKFKSIKKRDLNNDQMLLQ